MKVLLIHNYYGSAAPSGENQVFEAERDLLRAQGDTVQEFTRHSDEIRRQGHFGAVRGAVATPWNPVAAMEVRRAVDAFQPQVVHVHNTFPLLSPSIFSAIGRRAARVLTLHNYRLFCAAAIPMRAGQVCTDCLDRHSVWPALRHGCYRNSRLATLPLALSVGLHRTLQTWTRHVDAFIALTDFQRERMIAAGLPAELVHVKPNFYPGNPTILPWAARRPSVVFAGRLTAEKGVTALVKAWRLWGPAAPELRIVGDGELRGDLERLATTDPATQVRFLGPLDSTAAQAEIAHARLLVLPSEWFETFGMVILEGFAFGTPAAVSAIGPLPSIVQPGSNGVLFAPAQPESLLHAVRTVWETPGALEALARGARQAFEAHYSEDINYQQLMAIYRQAIAVTQGRGHPH